VTSGDERLPGEPAASGSRASEPGPQPASSGRGRPVRGLRAALRLALPSSTRGQLVVAALCALLGFGLAVQVTTIRESQGLGSAREEDLVRILDDLTAREQRLRVELDSLREARARLEADAGSEAALQEARRREQVLGVLAGTLPAAGPGVVLTVSDPVGSVPADVLLGTVEELRNAGAEALQIDDVRVVAQTYFVDVDGGGVEVDGIPLRPPYVFRVVGDPATVETALNIRGGARDAVARRDGASARIEPRDRVEVTALREQASPEFAEPVDP
jgi:uncharacterized protein YlxW (UPF0749 family)